MAWACIRSGISRSKSRLQRYEDASRPLSGIEIRFASKPSYREFFFTTAWTANYLQQFRFLLFVKKEKRKDAIWIFGEDRWFLWEENAEWRISRTIFSISYSPSKLESDLESFIVFVKLVSINRLVENARAIFQLRWPFFCTQIPSSSERQMYYFRINTFEIKFFLPFRIFQSDSTA